MKPTREQQAMADSIRRDAYERRMAEKRASPMNQWTPRDEILARFNDEFERAMYHTRRCYEKRQFSKLDDILPSLLKRYNIRGWRTLGTTEWVSPKNGDRWIGWLAERDSKFTDGSPAVDSGAGVVYYRPTNGSFDMCYRCDMYGTEKTGKLFTVNLTSYFTSHAMLRLKQRLDVPYLNDIGLMMFTSIILSRSWVYEADGDFVIANDLGEFWGDMTKHSVDILSTFVSIEDMTDVKRKRYNRHKKRFEKSMIKNYEKCRLSSLQYVLGQPLASDAAACYAKERGLPNSSSLSVMPYGSLTALSQVISLSQSPTECAWHSLLGKK